MEICCKFQLFSIYHFVKTHNISTPLNCSHLGFSNVWDLVLQTYFLACTGHRSFFLLRLNTRKWTIGDANGLGLDMYFVLAFWRQRNPKRFMFMEVSLVQLSQKIECVYNQTVSKPKTDTVYIYYGCHAFQKRNHRSSTPAPPAAGFFQLCRNPGDSNRYGEVTASESHAGWGWHQVQISTCLGLSYW